jgi:hypothetical protein
MDEASRPATYTYGLAAYCFGRHHEALYDVLFDRLDAEAISLRSILATDGVMGLPFPLRW